MYIVIGDIFKEPYIVKDSRGDHKGDEEFVRCLFIDEANYEINPVRHNWVVFIDELKYLIIDLNKEFILEHIESELNELPSKLLGLILVEKRDHLINELT